MNIYSYTLVSDNVVNLIRWLSSDNQLGNGGKTHVTTCFNPIYKRSGNNWQKWRHGMCLRDVRIPLTDPPQQSMVGRTVGGSVNTLKPRQNGRHFPDDIFKCIFLNENIWTLIEISPEFVPKGPINNIPALVQIMAWHRPDDKPLS